MQETLPIHIDNADNRRVVACHAALGDVEAGP